MLTEHFGQDIWRMLAEAQVFGRRPGPRRARPSAAPTSGPPPRCDQPVAELGGPGRGAGHTRLESGVRHRLPGAVGEPRRALSPPGARRGVGRGRCRGVRDAAGPVARRSRVTRVSAGSCGGLAEEVGQAGAGQHREAVGGARAGHEELNSSSRAAPDSGPVRSPLWTPPGTWGQGVSVARFRARGRYSVGRRVGPHERRGAAASSALCASARWAAARSRARATGPSITSVRTRSALVAECCRSTV